ncbi:MAG: SpoIIE family protein phosphatase, partial [archaeon]|nr:SpoIIE family protein phosphatase [archaeon]
MGAWRPLASQPYPHLESHVCVVPHPDKVAKGGEDAYAVSRCGRVVAVADGVGGWAEHGVDPALYSRRLMNGVAEAADGGAGGGLERPVKYLERAWRGAGTVLGSSTALVAALREDYSLEVCNVGDSAMMIVREGAILFRSEEQTHGFNFPFQLGSQGDDISTAQSYSQQLQPGDVVVLASDGLWDNLQDDAVLEIIN